jgi:hypothetical protein
MSNQKMHPLIQQTENYLECWKQFNHFINLAHAKKFGSEDETHFLELKSVLVQELERILAGMEVSSPTKEEIHGLIGNSPSLRYLSEMSEGFHRLACHPGPTQGPPTGARDQNRPRRVGRTIRESLKTPPHPHWLRRLEKTKADSARRNQPFLLPGMAPAK